MRDNGLQNIPYENKGPGWFETLRIIFFIVTVILIPLTKLGWRQGWLFTAWGVVLGTGIYGLLFDSFGDTGHLIALPIYAVFLTLGIMYWRWRLRQNRGGFIGSPTNPRAPSELYDEDYYD